MPQLRERRGHQAVQSFVPSCASAGLATLPDIASRIAIERELLLGDDFVIFIEHLIPNGRREAASPDRLHCLVEGQIVVVEDGVNWVSLHVDTVQID